MSWYIEFKGKKYPVLDAPDEVIENLLPGHRAFLDESRALTLEENAQRDFYARLEELRKGAIRESKGVIHGSDDGWTVLLRKYRQDCAG